MSMHGPLSEKASASMAVNIMLKNVGAKTHPCLTPFETTDKNILNVKQILKSETKLCMDHPLVESNHHSLGVDISNSPVQIEPHFPNMNQKTAS
ncbi:hypothetical protein DPMN_007450 [Dreissena polymorpha]|uniref:Uncharacterized protein n=1 Tax=Dreissena polymorpha TaxID=45954 RepID=A0A9D4MW85_DREPO|nr:hypothetical protein DPMN_007450 [Dreissena polymorpha]